MLINSIIAATLMFLIPVAPLLDSQAFLFLLFVFLFSSVGRSYSFVVPLIFNQHFDAAKKDREIVRLWNTLSDQIHVVNVFGFSLMMYNLHWKWQICFTIITGAFILAQIIFYFSVEEVSEVENQTSQNVQPYNSAIQFLKLPGNALWVINISVQIGTKIQLVLWIPYYFGKIGL